MVKRFIFTLCFILFSITNYAVIYYVSSNGNDNNNGTSISSPWRTISKVNSRSYVAGDQILFERGGIYRGSLTINQSGTASNPIVISSYGEGNNPLFLGSQTFNNWIIHQGNIWKTTVTSTNIPYIFQNDQLLTLARFPNTGWLRNDNGSATQINDAELTQSSGYWNGARLIVRSSAWSYHIATINSYTSGVLNFNSIGGYNLSNRQWGYFLCNKLSELDSPGEWFWDSTNSTLYLWPLENANPNNSNIEVSTTNYAIRINSSRQYVNVSNISCKYYTDIAIQISGSNNKVENCVVSKSNRGMTVFGNNNLVKNCNVNNVYGTGLFITTGNNNIIEDNLFTDIATVPGLGESGWGYFGLRSSGLGNIIRRNTLNKIGYIGIGFSDNTLVEYNRIDNACYTLNDGAAIAFDNVDGAIVRYNIISNVIGDVESCAPNYNGCDPKGNGIYFGNVSLKNTLITNNTAFNCNGAGIWVDHTMVSTGNQVTNNNLFNNSLHQIGFTDYSNYNGPGATAPYAISQYNDIISGNVLYCLNSAQQTMFHINRWFTGVDFGTFTNNRYYNPWNSVSIQIQRFLNSPPFLNYNLSQWQSVRGDDVGSAQSPLTPSTAGPIFHHMIVYNEQYSAQSISIPTGTWSDTYNNLYNNSIFLEPFESKIIYKVSPTIILNAKVFLQGPLKNGLMIDSLRTKKLIPSTNGAQTINSSVLSVSGNSAIVDWITVELRNSNNPANVIFSKNVLLQRDGDVVDIDGVSPVYLDVVAGNYFVSIKHRNHLSVMTANPISLPGNIDFSTINTFGTQSLITVGNIKAMWAGDCNQDNTIKYTGTNNDRDFVLSKIGGVIPTNTTLGYYSEDLNMDGIVKYTGSDNDRDIILSNIGGTVPTNTRTAQLP